MISANSQHKVMMQFLPLSRFNSRRKSIAAVGVLLSGLAALFVLWQAGLPAVPQIEQAVAFRALTLDNEPLEVSPNPGQPVVLNFWATWCVPCVVEMPMLEAAHQKHQVNDLLLIGINAGENPETVQQWIAQNNINFPIVIDPYFELEQAYEVRQIYPTTFFIDARGNIKHVHRGPLSEDDLNDNLALIGIE